MLYCDHCHLHLCGNCLLSCTHDHSTNCPNILRYMRKDETHLQYVPSSDHSYKKKKSKDAVVPTNDSYFASLASAWMNTFEENVSKKIKKLQAERSQTHDPGGFVWQYTIMPHICIRPGWRLRIYHLYQCFVSLFLKGALHIKWITFDQILEHHLWTTYLFAYCFLYILFIVHDD